jgi:hypothetical protein
MSAFDGKHIIVKVGSVTVLGQTSGSLDYSIDMLETTDKLSKDPVTGITHKTYIPGDRDGTISIEGNTSMDANGWPELYDLYANQTVAATIYYGSTVAGQKYYSQSGFLSSLTRTDGQNAIATYSATFQKSGAASEAVVPT